MNSLTFGDHTFSLFSCGSSGQRCVQVDPPLTGDESDSLELSIAKWRFIVGVLEIGRTIDICGGTDTCALCAITECCSQCIVITHGDGEPGCSDTPYDNWRADKSLESAKAELAFLESLRDKTSGAV